MKRFLLIIAIAMCSTFAFSQEITLSFTGKTIRGRHVDMDSIRINNLTQGWSIMLVAPDTACSFGITSVNMPSANAGGLSQNVPNPFYGTTEVNLALPKPDKVNMQALDMGGRIFANYNGDLPEGEHRFAVSLTTPQSYLLSANTSDGTSSIKMINLGSGGTNSITYIGQVAEKALRDGDYDLAIGDALECTGYTTYCDSIYESETLDVTVGDSNTPRTLRFNLRSGVTVDEITACGGYTWIDNNRYVESNNTATYTLTNSIGCDSVVRLDLTIYPIYYTQPRIDACDSYECNDTVFTQTGTYTFYLHSIHGCDSIVFLHLHIRNETHEIDSTVCDSYEWEGQTYTVDSTFSTTYPNQYGCDSIIAINFHVNHSTETIDTREECSSFVWIDGNTYTESNNEATYTYTAENGCDSVVRLNLTITRIEHEFYASACEYYGWDGIGYNATGDYTRTYTAANGCDSVVTLHFTKLGNLIRDIVYICDDDSYTWINGRTYTIEDLGQGWSNIDDSYTYTNSYGCDSTIYLYLFFKTDEVVDTHRACNSFTWIDGVTYTESNNTATVTYTNQYGCDSVVHLNLTIGHNDYVEVTAEEWSYYQMSNGEYFTESGDYLRTLQSSCGCDSTVLLHLTIIGENGLEGTFYDERDNITYRTIQYGQQTWFAEDLRTNYYADGTPIGTPPSNSGYVFYYYRYSNHGGFYYVPSIANNNEHGKVCPTGWHIPSRTEWEELFTMLRIRDEYICGNDSSILKAISNATGWNTSDVECSPGNDMVTNNSSGLGLNPDGSAWICPQEKSVLSGIGEYANYMTSSNEQIIFYKYYTNPRWFSYQTCRAYFVRCVMDY
ncbi:MAG: fibrobacter succinogenes major paralogous domain-containing protein [Bacteroidales bacterium]|nr:fibrobacter succinogenes major paralogous domain-containing protein [Bacteroidales bacterium]